MRISNKGKRVIVPLIYILFVLIILAAIYLTYPKDENKDSESSSFFPQELSGMILEDEYSGERAKSEIKNMHLGDFDFISGHVGYYTDDFGRSARFWISVFTNEDEAKNITERMTNEISKGVTPFSIPEDVDINNSIVENVYFVEGMEQNHYYWYKNDKVLWVALTNFDEEQGMILLNSSINDLG
jgi:hypothetical protein